MDRFWSSSSSSTAATATTTASTAANRIVPQKSDETVESSSSPPTASSPWHHRISSFLHRFILKKPSLASSPPPPIKKVLVIGIHGWFPATRFVQTIVGEPIGTSHRLCSVAQSSIESIPDLVDVDVTYIPLEGSGTIMNRVTEFTHFLTSSYKHTLEESDAVWIVAHSQGTIVAPILLHEGWKNGWWKDTTQVTLLSMAGIAHGPFPELKESVIVKYVEKDAVRELFAFHYGPMDPSDHECEHVQVIYRTSLSQCLEKGVSVVAVASFMDQVVPMYSALMHGFHHPNIHRAVYVDSHNDSDDFLMKLVTFLVRVRNKGRSDHGLLVYLSETLAGSLYNGVEHSTIYDEPEVYKLAIRIALLRSRTVGEPMKIQWNEYTKSPYYIPWAMRDLLADDDIVKNDEELVRELGDVLRSFTEWRPMMKAAKDLKYRLDPVKTKL